MVKDTSTANLIKGALWLFAISLVPFAILLEGTVIFKIANILVLIGFGLIIFVCILLAFDVHRRIKEKYFPDIREKPSNEYWEKLKVKGKLVEVRGVPPFLSIIYLFLAIYFCIVLLQLYLAATCFVIPEYFNFCSLIAEKNMFMEVPLY